MHYNTCILCRKVVIKNNVGPNTCSVYSYDNVIYYEFMILFDTVNPISHYLWDVLFQRIFLSHCNNVQ